MYKIIGLIIPIILSYQKTGCYTQIAHHKQRSTIEHVKIDESDFCNLINQGKFDLTGVIINNFLDTSKENNNNNLEILRAWLEKKECVVKAEIIHNVIIDTSPLQMEIIVHYRSNGRIIEKIMDIELRGKIRFVRYCQ